MRINPGSGPVTDASEEEAKKNIEAFMEDINLPGTTWIRSPGADYGEGRYAFTLYRGEELSVEVQMPGLPLENVRYMDKSQNIWHYPRLYVDDSSWVWAFALNSAQRELSGEVPS